jgi:hypothetical protein
MILSCRVIGLETCSTRALILGQTSPHTPSLDTPSVRGRYVRNFAVQVGRDDLQVTGNNGGWTHWLWKSENAISEHDVVYLVEERWYRCPDRARILTRPG